MKPAPFEYFAPATRDEALALLAAHGDDAKALAGGQSLVPAMNFRLARPAMLIDLNGIADLFGIAATADGGLRIGAMTRQRTVERSALVAERAPLVAETIPDIAHPQIRNRGTFGGSLAHNDPAAELPALAVALDAEMHAQSATGERTIPAAEFFQGLFTTALSPDELLVAVTLPTLPPHTGTAFAEFARRHGDYALAGAAARITLAADGSIAAGRLVLLALGDGPIRVQGVETTLQGAPASAESINAAAATVDAEIDPGSDIHATAVYRRHLAQVLARRTLTTALERAQQEEHV